MESGTKLGHYEISTLLGTDQADAPANLIAVQNWLEELMRLVP
jgi:hypothetical protein